ncbi:MAG TPA: 50S ribosomal protein L18 [Candidatus Omnitrophota bacterium]|nr:50S ribosomal protein L18 [Candidatus Omnitrophota bacterium]
MVHVKEWGRIQRHRRVRQKITGTAERPRVAVHRSLKNICVQAIDDIAQKTIASFSSLDKEFLKTAPQKGKITVAEQLGKSFAEALKKKNVQKIAFDRGGYLYHGRVKALAEAMRKNGIQF